MVWDVQISHWNGSISFAYYAVNFLRVSGGSVSLRYQLVRCYNVSKTSVSFRYQLWYLRDMLSWWISLRYQLQRRDDVLAWYLTSRPIWNLNETSLRGRMPGKLVIPPQPFGQHHNVQKCELSHSFCTEQPLFSSIPLFYKISLLPHII